MLPQLAKLSTSLTNFLFYSKIQYNPVSKWTKSNLVLKSDECVRLPWVLALLVLQINWGTLNNLVINSPLERLSYYLTWQIDPSPGIWLPPSLSPSLFAPSSLFYRPFFTPPFHLLSFFTSFPPPLLSWGFLGGSTAEYWSRSRDAPGAFSQTFMCDRLWWEWWIWPQLTVHHLSRNGGGTRENVCLPAERVPFILWQWWSCCQHHSMCERHMWACICTRDRGTEKKTLIGTDCAFTKSTYWLPTGPWQVCIQLRTGVTRSHSVPALFVLWPRVHQRCVLQLITD